MLRDERKSLSLIYPDIESVSHVLERTQGPLESDRKPGWMAEEDKRTRELIDDVLSCLRLLRRECVNVLCYSTTLQRERVDVAARLSDHVTGIKPSTCEEYGHFTYRLEEQKLQEFWQSYSQRVLPAYLRRAIRSFNHGIDEKHADDRLQDYVTGLETIFVQDDKELGYKLQIRAATLLNSGEERGFIYEAMKEAYRVRGGVAHGSPIKKIEIGKRTLDLARLNELLETYLRYAIRGCLMIQNAGMEFKPEDLDSLLLDPECVKELCNVVQHFQRQFMLCLFCGSATRGDNEYCEVCGTRQQITRHRCIDQKACGAMPQT